MAINENSTGHFLEIRLSGKRQQISGTNISAERSFQIELPDEFSTQDVERASKDLNALVPILQNNPQEAVKLFNSVTCGNYNNACSIAKNIGVTEKAFTQEGGQLIGWVVAAVIVVVIIATEGEAE